MSDYIFVAIVRKPQGVKGDLRLSVFLDDPKAILNFKSFLIEGEAGERSAERVYSVSSDFAVKLEGVNTFEEAEKLKNKKVLVKKEVLSALKKEGDFFIEDLIGKTAVLTSGEELGVIDDVENYGASDVVFIKSNKYKELSFANIGGIILSINSDKNQAILDAQKFKEVSVFNDDEVNDED